MSTTDAVLIVVPELGEEMVTVGAVTSFPVEGCGVTSSCGLCVEPLSRAAMDCDDREIPARTNVAGPPAVTIEVTSTSAQLPAATAPERTEMLPGSGAFP
jgi:hypothetical protein